MWPTRWLTARPASRRGECWRRSGDRASDEASIDVGSGGDDGFLMKAFRSPARRQLRGRVGLPVMFSTVTLGSGVQGAKFGNSGDSLCSFPSSCHSNWLQLLVACVWFWVHPSHPVLGCFIRSASPFDARFCCFITPKCDSTVLSDLYRSTLYSALMLLQTELIYIAFCFGLFNVNPSGLATELAWLTAQN